MSVKCQTLPEVGLTNYTVGKLALDDSPTAFDFALILTVSAAVYILQAVKGKAYALHNSYVALDVSLGILRPDKHLIVVNKVLNKCAGEQYPYEIGNM